MFDVSNFKKGKLIFFAVATVIAMPLVSHSDDFSTLREFLTVPIFYGTANIDDAPAGSVIYDSNSNNFKGRSPNGNWSDLSTSNTVFYVDANIAGANASLGTAAQSSYTEITNSSLSLTNNSGSDLSVQIACSSGTASSGTTCTSDESIGIAFTIPEAGSYQACASFTHFFAINTAPAGVWSTFQIIETPNTSATITQEGKSRITSGNYFQAMTGVQHDFNIPVRLCGTFVFSSTGQKTLRVMYEQTINTGSPLANNIRADGSSSQGQNDIHWEVYRIR